MPSNLDVCISCRAIQLPPETKPLVSPLSALLGTNHVPSDAQRCLAEEFLVEFSAEITSLEGQLSRLRQFKERLELYRREHISVLTKFRMLPVKVLAMIFKIFVDSLSRWEEPLASTASDYLQSGYPYHRSISRMKPPFTIASVCQQWRAVAISTPSLWRNIDLTGDSSFTRLGDPMSCLLTRSGQQHLNVAIDLPGRTANPSFFSAFCGSSSRWQNARIVYNHEKDFKALVPSHWNLPQLKSLSLGSEFIVTSLPSIYAPKLEKLELCQTFIKPNFPWHQLQELSLLRVGISIVMYCLKACPGLTRLHCQLFNAGYDISSASRIKQSPPLVHRNLLTLETFEDSAKMCPPSDYVLRYLELPALQVLTLSIPCWKGEHSISDQSFPNFISRSQCKLKTFSLECIQMSKTNVTLYSSLVPTLTTLKLTENQVCIYSDLLGLLAAVDGDNIIFPKLQHLEYNFYARSTWDSDYHKIFTGLVPVIKARWEMVSETDAACPLQSMKIRGEKPYQELNSFEAYRDLERQCRKGFNLEMEFERS